ncbi:MAG: hypothetical protein HAW59_02890 [Betaproteobacteria bacterium]|nr:hypothetical protein [Betaproteobacteria bacterium]
MAKLYHTFPPPPNPPPKIRPPAVGILDSRLCGNDGGGGFWRRRGMV